MQTLSRADLTFAVCLAALAGYVDALGFLTSGGFFVSFMSGNSTRLGVGLGSGGWAFATIAAGLIAAFTFGVFAGSITGDRAGRRRRSAVLALVTLLLAVAAVLHPTAFPLSGSLLFATAMGAENAVFQQEGRSNFGLTYMTGALVRIGRGLAAGAMGRGDREWVRYFWLWLGLTAGAVAGAWAGMRSPALASLAATAICALLCGWAYAVEGRGAAP